MSLSLRLATVTDEAALKALFAAARADLLALLPDGLAETVLAQQWAAWRLHLAQHWPEHQIWLLERHGRPVAQATAARRDGMLRLLDLAVAPEGRRQGLGAYLLREVLSRMGAGCECVELNVDRDNRPAMGLYAKLGFQTIGGDALQDHLRLMLPPAQARG